MATLREHAIKKGLVRKPWATAKDFIAITSPSYRTSAGVTITLRAKIEAVQKVLAKALKPERKLLTAVRFTDGRIEEVHEAKQAKEEKLVQLPKEEPQKPEPKAAVTVARPVVGCPMPEFPAADIRASRVLETFLDPDQIRDYRETGAFITRGADTGHRYLVANRERPKMLKRCGGRQLFDLEEDRSLCIHDWSVPPPEEMLALHLLLVTPGNESYVRALPNAYEEEQQTGQTDRWR